MENEVAGVVAEVHVLEPHVAPEGHQRPVRPLPGPQAGLFPAGHQAVSLLPDADQIRGAVVHLRRLVHGGKDTLRAGQGRQQQVGLLGELVDGQGRLPDKDQIAGQAPHIGGPLQGHDAAQHRHDGVVDIGDGDHRRDHGGRITLGPGARLAEGLVLLPELPEALRLVVEHLDHLLAGHHLLDEAVQISQAGLLLGVVGLAVGPAEADIAEHGGIPHRHHQGQLPVEDEEDHQCPHHLDEALDHHGEAVVQRVGDGVHVVGEVAHHVAVAAGVKEPQGQGLEMGEQVPADVVEHLLGRLHHGLGVPQGAQGSQGVDPGGDGHTQDQGVEIPRRQGVDHRPDHIGPQQIGQGADGHQHRHGQQEELVPPHIGQQGADGVPQILRLFTAGRLRGHRRPLLSSGMRRSPGRWGRRPAGRHGCPPRGPGRPPE